MRWDTVVGDKRLCSFGQNQVQAGRLEPLAVSFWESHLHPLWLTSFSCKMGWDLLLVHSVRFDHMCVVTYMFICTGADAYMPWHIGGGQATTWCSLPCLKMGLLCLSTNYIRCSNLKICEVVSISASNLSTTVLGLQMLPDASGFLWGLGSKQGRASHRFTHWTILKTFMEFFSRIHKSCSWIPLQWLTLQRFLFYVTHGKTLFPISTLTPISECVGWGNNKPVLLNKIKVDCKDTNSLF